MDPNGIQCSIDYPYNDNAVGYHGFTLPRSFTRADYGRINYGISSTLSIVLSPGKSFTLAHHGKQAYRGFSNPSIDHSRDPILDYFSLASIWGNSRALFLSMIGRNKTRILFALDPARGLFWGFIAAHQLRLKLNVPYTVIRAHTAMGCSFTMLSDYIKDFNSFCFMRTGRLQRCLMGEFYSRATRLKSRKEKNEGAYCAH